MTITCWSLGAASAGSFLPMLFMPSAAGAGAAVAAGTAVAAGAAGAVVAAGAGAAGAIVAAGAAGAAGLAGAAVGVGDAQAVSARASTTLWVMVFANRFFIYSPFDV